jgi:hypothetical protein
MTVVTGPWLVEPGNGAHVSVPDDPYGRYGIYVRDDERAAGAEECWFTGGRKGGVRWSELARRTPRVLRPGRVALDHRQRSEALTAAAAGLSNFARAHLVGGLLELVAKLAEDEETYADAMRCIERARLSGGEVSP